MPPRVLADVAVSREHASAMDTSNDDAIATFIAFTGADNQMAAQFLQMANNDVEMAASLFFADDSGRVSPVRGWRSKAVSSSIEAML